MNYRFKLDRPIRRLLGGWGRWVSYRETETGYRFGMDDPVWYYIWFEDGFFWSGEAARNGEPNRAFRSTTLEDAERFWLMKISSLYGGWANWIAGTRYPEDLKYLAPGFEQIALPDHWNSLRRVSSGEQLPIFTKGGDQYFSDLVGFSYLADLSIPDLVKAFTPPGTMPRPKLEQ